MKLNNIVKLLVWVMVTLVMTGCSGTSTGKELPPPSAVYLERVNLIGTWDYSMSTVNSRCDGRAVQGIEIIESLNGDTSRIGDIILDGERFALDGFDNCDIVPIDAVIQVLSGSSSTLTRDEFIDMRYQLNAWDDTVKAISVDGWTDTRIETSIVHKNGMIVTIIMTR